jgi:hypothetical protein
MSDAVGSSRRTFIQRAVATGLAAPLSGPCTFVPTPPICVVGRRIALALRHQESYAIGLDWIDVEAITSGRVLRASSASSTGPTWLETTTRMALRRQGEPLRNATGVLLLIGVMPSDLRRSDLPGARQAVRAAATTASVIYGLHPLEDPEGRPTVTILASWS